MYIRSEDTCIGEPLSYLSVLAAASFSSAPRGVAAQDPSLLLSCYAAKNMSAFGWLVTALVVSCLAGAGVAGYVFYKYRLRV